jgi:small subunit ribosomal protein S16
MAVKIRLARRGRKKLALYDIIVTDARSPRDGRFIDKLGNYNPNTHPATIVLEEESALQWLRKGAQPTNTVRTILSARGVLLKKHLQLGVDKGAITQEDATKKLEAWKQGKEKQATTNGKQTTTETTNTPKQQKNTPEARKDTPLQTRENLQTATASPEATAPQPDPQKATLAASPENSHDQNT